MTKIDLGGCPYCDRPKDADGGINHLGGCAGLDTISLNRLQHDWLTGEIERLRRALDKIGLGGQEARLLVKWANEALRGEDEPSSEAYCTCPDSYPNGGHHPDCNSQKAEPSAPQNSRHAAAALATESTSQAAPGSIVQQPSPKAMLPDEDIAEALERQGDPLSARAARHIRIKWQTEEGLRQQLDRTLGQSYHVDPTGKTREPPHCPSCNCGSEPSASQAHEHYQPQIDDLISTNNQLREALRVAQDRVIGCGGVLAALNEGLSIDTSAQKSTPPQIPKAVHYAASHTPGKLCDGVIYCERCDQIKSAQRTGSDV